MDVSWRWAAAGLATALTMTMPAVATAAPDGPAQGRMIVLGDLGENRSYAEDVNDRGDIVGISLSGDARGYLPALWRQGRTEPIALDVQGSPTAINNDGVVTGPVEGTATLYLWRNGRTTHFTRPGGGEEVRPADINDRGQVVGSSYDAATGGWRAFILDRGVFTDLPTPAGSESRARAVNNRGVVLGLLTDVTTFADRAVVWTPAGSAERPRWNLVDLGSLGGGNTQPTAINDDNQVIGSSDVPESGLPHPFLWQNGRMTDLLDGVSAIHGVASAINDSGLVVGHIQLSLAVDFHAVVWANGRFADIGVPEDNSEAQAVNDRGQVAGLVHVVRDDQYLGDRPFRWDSGRTRLFTPPGASYNMQVLGLDAAGRITASIITDEEAVLLRSRG